MARRRQPKKPRKEFAKDTSDEDTTEDEKEEDEDVQPNGHKCVDSVAQATILFPVCDDSNNAAIVTPINASNGNKSINELHVNDDPTLCDSGEKSTINISSIPPAASISKEKNLKKRKKKLELYVKCKAMKNDMESVDKWMIAFCCYKCTCPNEVKIKDGIDFVQPGIGHFYHRTCCHAAEKISKKWKSPLEKALWRAEPSIEELHLCGIAIPETKSATWDEIWKKFETIKNQEAALYNDDTLAAPDAILNTNSAYAKNRSEFAKHCKLISKRPAVVLNMFGGIGSAIIALKRNGIAISKIIHVEHDMVATHVFKWNHDPAYKRDLAKLDTTDLKMNSDQGIEQIFYSSYENFVMELDKGSHEDIDIVIGSPPASDFAAINPNRQGIYGSTGLYMIEFAKLIQSIKDRQDTPLYYLACNTVIRNRKGDPSKAEYKKGVLEEIKKAFGITWSYEFEASDVSPCNRKSTYFSNIPFVFTDFERGSTISAMSCIEDSFQHAANIIQPDLPSKVNRFMASISGIDDDRMLVYKTASDSPKSKGSKAIYVCRTLHTSEREKMMGFPIGYVAEPVKDLFNSILEDGFGTGIMCTKENRKTKHWKKILPKHYQKFSGNYHDFPEKFRSDAFKFTSVVGQPITLKLAPPLSGKEIEHYTEDQYAKRLIGNAFCIPVLEELLRPLQNVFEARQYKGYDYEYEWIKSAPSK